MGRHRWKRPAAMLTAILLGLAPALSCADVMMLWRGDGLQAVKSGIESGRTEALPALDAVTRHAKEALARGPYSVVDKTNFAGDDIHDYYSQGPYWWPDPDSPDGLPYIRRDGQVNPEKYGDGFDSKRRHDMTLDVTALTLAGYFTGDRHYLEHAARQIRTWFIAPETLMNPNMDYAQSIPGRSAGRPAGIIDSRAFVYSIDAALTLHQLDALNDDDLATLKSWFERMAHWLETSEIGQGERAAKNNHGTFYDLQLASFHWFAGNREAARQVIDRFCETRISPQVEPDGSQPLELARTKPYHYSLFNLQAMINMALLARRMQLDTDDPGCSMEDGIRRGLEYVAGRPEATMQWPSGSGNSPAERQFQLQVLYKFLAGPDDGRDPFPRSRDMFQSSVIHLLITTDPTE
jgi:hypothetical protein